jgi:membrane-bound lytic murein transglycosylase B
MPTHYPVRFDTTLPDLDALLAPDILPTFSVASFTAKGAVLEGDALQHTGPLALVELQNGADAPATWPARRTSTPSPATTGAATTRWR